MHIGLSNCIYALANGLYTWRHYQVLRELHEAAKTAASKSNSCTIANQRKIYFLHEGFSHLCKKRYQTPRRDILAEAKDWTVAADIEGLRHYPQVLIEGGKRPDMVLLQMKSQMKSYEESRRKPCISGVNDLPKLRGQLLGREMPYCQEK